MNKVILMATGETSSLGPSRCSAGLFPSFALRLANLYKVPLPKCEGNGKGLQVLFVFFHQFLSLSRLLCSLLHLSFSSLTSLTSLYSQYIHAMYELFTKLEQLINHILLFSQSIHMTYETMTDLNSLLIVLYCTHSLYTRCMKP